MICTNTPPAEAGASHKTRALDVPTGSALNREGEDRQSTDARIACGMRGLENDVRELEHMANIMCENFDDVGRYRESPFRPGERVVVMTQYETEQLSFLINNCQQRVRQLRERYDEALEGKVA